MRNIINYPFKLGKMRFKRPYFLEKLRGSMPPEPLPFVRLLALGELPH